MAAQEKLTGRLQMGKGAFLEFKTDDSKPVDDLYHHWVEGSYDGQPDSDVVEVGAHWHKFHDERWQVVYGSISALIGHDWKTVTPADGLVVVPRGIVHGFKFIKGEKTMFKEWTNPPGDFKEKFFEDILDEGKMSLVTALRAAYDGDTYFALPGGFKWLDEAFTLGLGRVMKWMYPKKNHGIAAKGLEVQ